MRLPYGLCVYGITHLLGLNAAGTSRANPQPLSTLDLLDLAVELGFSGIELPVQRVDQAADAGRLRDVRQALAERGLWVVLAAGPLATLDPEPWLPQAEALGATTIRCTLSAVLCGERAQVGGHTGWLRLLDDVARKLVELAPQLEARGLRLAIENHQDADSTELVALCERVGSPAVGITLDTGNPLAVGEDILAFCDAVLPHLHHVHLKDYRMAPFERGYRLARCALGAGVVPFAPLLDRLQARPQVQPSVELAALTARPIRVLDDDWWAELGPREVRSFVPVLDLWRAQEASANGADEWRTPWERGADGELPAYERDQLAASVAYLRGLTEAQEAKAAQGG